MQETSWNEIKATVQQLNPEFYEAIEEVRPDPRLKLYILEYEYGQKITDVHNFYFPDGTAISKSTKFGIPQMFLLEGMIELFIETNTSRVPWELFNPGKVFPMVMYTDESMKSKFSSNNSALTAGIRSSYMLQLHAFNEYYANLKKYYQIPNEYKPTNPLDHHKIFHEIAKKEHSPWRVKVLMFEKKWLEHIWENPQWLPLRSFFYKHAFKMASPWYWSLMFNQAIRDITRTYEFKLKDYSEDIIKQIIFSAAGVLPAFIPAYDERALPLHTIAKSFNEFYNTHNLPVIMHAWRSDDAGETRYLPIAQNTVTTYDVKTYRPLIYLTEIKQYLPEYLKALGTHPLTCDVIYKQMQEHLKTNYYSEKGVEAEGILPARALQNDPRIIKAYEQYRVRSDQTFPERAPFLKAFVGFTFT